MKPYYHDEAAGITIYHGDCREVIETPQSDEIAHGRSMGTAGSMKSFLRRYEVSCSGVSRSCDVLVTDPPYGIAYHSGQYGALDRSIVGDEDTSVRDEILRRWEGRPALVFGSWKRERPAGTHTLLVWDTMGALGMGDLSVPWKPSHQEIYVLGRGFVGDRTTDVLRFPPVQSMAANGRVHPHQKPIGLMQELISKCPPGIVVDPFCGSGSTLVAAKEMGRKCIGIEIEERYCEIASRRLQQGILFPAQ